MVEIKKKTKKIKRVKPVENILKSGIIISRVDFPVTVKYENSNLRISPRSQLHLKDISKLGKLPNGIFVKS